MSRHVSLFAALVALASLAVSVHMAVVNHHLRVRLEVLEDDAAECHFRVHHAHPW